MALQVSIESEQLGYVFPEAYAKISQIVSYNNNSYITVVFYANAEARAEARARELGEHLQRMLCSIHLCRPSSRCPRQRTGRNYCRRLAC